MKAIRRLLTSVLLSASILIMVDSARCQSGGEKLFLVSGFPTSRYPSTLPIVLYRFNNTGMLEIVKTLSNSPADAVLIDYDDEFLAVTSPSLGANDVTTVDFSTGLPADTEPLGRDNSAYVYDTRIIKSKAGGPPTLIVRLGGADKPFLTAAINSSALSLTNLGPSNCSLLIAGSYGVGVVWSDGIQIRASSGKLSSTPAFARDIPCALDLSLPPQQGPIASATQFLDVNTNEVAVVSSSNKVFSSVGSLGSQLDYICYKPTETWRSVNVPGSVSWPRGIGEWIAYVVADKSADHKATSRDVDMKANEDIATSVELNESGAYFPGMLFLFNTATGRRYVIDTGARDSEPLFISGTTTYFRVGTSIYSAELGTKEYIDLAASHLLSKDPRLAQVHWAFMSPQ